MLGGKVVKIPCCCVLSVLGPTPDHLPLPPSGGLLIVFCVISEFYTDKKKQRETSLCHIVCISSFIMFFYGWKTEAHRKIK